MIYNATIYNDSWNTKKLYELGDFSRGKSKHRPRNDPKLFDNGEYPLVQTGDIKAATLYVSKHEAAYNEFGLSQSKLWPTGTLCITIAANIAETGILAYPMCFPDSIVGFTANQAETSEQFMHYIFTYIRQSIQNSVSGSIQDNINIEYLKSLDFKIPEKSYQDKIVSVLSGLDEKIELNSKICSELEDMAKTLYDYWFVQFDFPDENGKPYRTSGGEMIWNEQLKRKIPRGWNVTTINDMTHSYRGVSYDKKYLLPTAENGILVLRGNNIQNNRLVYDTNVAYVPCSLVSKEQQIRAHDIILTMSSGSKDHIGKCTMFQYDSPHTYGAFLTKFTPDSDKVGFVYLSMISDFFKKKIQAICNGTGINNLTNETFDNLLFPKPGKTILGYFEEIVAPLFEKMGDCDRENEELTKLRDWLLPMLMNGQARVE